MATPSPKPQARTTAQPLRPQPAPDPNENPDSDLELPPGFTSKAAYELHLRVKRHKESDPEGWARRDAQIRWAEENGLFEPPFNAPPAGKNRISLG